MVKLGALDEDGEVTELGRLMALFPVEPSLARMIVASVEFHCLDDVLTIAAMLSSEEIWYSPRRKKGGGASSQQHRGGRDSDRYNDHMKKAFEARQRLSHPDGDHLSFLAVYNEWIRRGASHEWCLVGDEYVPHPASSPPQLSSTNCLHFVASGQFC